MKRILCVCLVLAALFQSRSIARAQQPRQPGPVPVPEKVFNWYPEELPLKERKIYVEVDIPNANTAPNQFDELAGKSPLLGERFGNMVGHIIPVRFRIFLLKSEPGNDEIAVQFGGLNSSPPRLTILPVRFPDWQVADRSVLAPGMEPISIVSVPNVTLEWGGQQYECSRMIQVTLLVQTFKDPKFRMNLWLELTYAMKKLPNGSLDWRPLETPDFWVDMVDVADPGLVLSIGNTAEVAQVRPLVPGIALVAVGSVLVLLNLLFWGMRYARRNVVTENALDPAEGLSHLIAGIKQRTAVPDGYALTPADAAAIVTGIGAYVKRTDNVDISSWTVEELEKRQDEITDGEQWLKILKPLKRRVVQLGERLSPKAFKRILERIAAICPAV